MNKKVFFTSTAILGVVLFASCLFINKSSFNLFAADRPHFGNHYAEKMPTDTKSGWHEYWICCECGQVFLEEPTSGTWHDQDPSKMIGTVDKDHPAYYGGGDVYIDDPFDF